MRDFISVVIPAHNRQESLEKAIASLLSQDYPKDKYEIIVVDDSSPRLALPRSPLLRHLVIPPTTHTVARNHGIRHSSGDIVAFTDDDCLPDKGWLRQLAQHFASPETAGVEGRTVTEGRMPVNAHATENADGGKFPTCNLAFRKPVLKEAGGFDESYGFFREDTDLAFSVMGKGRKIVFSKDAVVYHPPRKIPHSAPLKELGMIKSDIRLHRKFPSLYRQYIGRLGGGGVKVSASVWALSLFFAYLVFYGLYLSLIPLALILSLKYLTHLRKRAFSLKGYASYIAFSWLRDLAYPFYFAYYYLTEKGR